jgi:hypothetical protein
MSTSTGARTAAPAADRNSMFHEGYVKVTGFFAQPDPEWYENIHAPDFLSFAAPHLARYARNWVRGVRYGERPAFSTITEIHFASESDANAVRSLMATPAARPLLEHTMEQRARLGVVDDIQPPGLGLFPVTPEPADPPRPEHSVLPRQALLLRRKEGAAQSAFEAAVRAIATDMASGGGGIATAIDLFAAGEPAPRPDAVVYVAGEADAPLANRPELEVTVILDVETISSVVGAGLVR